MTDHPQDNQEKVQPVFPRRPLFLSILCVFSFAYFGILALLALLGIVNSGWITRIADTYREVPGTATPPPLVIFLVLFLLHAALVAATFLIWKMHRRGYLLFGALILGAVVFQLITPYGSPLGIATEVLLLILAGFFFRRMR